MISAVIITYNEEKYIEQCIHSLTSIVDEILIVDSYSTDNTKRICEAMDVRFIQHPFQGYIEQKNWAINQAKYDYILSLDGDELISDELAQNILKEKAHLKYDGYYFNRLNNYYGTWIKHSGAYPDRKLRLFNKTKGRWGGTNPHDIFVLEKGTRTKRVHGDIIHYYYDSLNEHLQKILDFSTIHAQALFDSGKRSNLLTLFINPQWRFIRDYFFNLGILGGFNGYLICYLNAYSCLLKYLKLRQLSKGGDNPLIPGFNYIKI